MNQKIGSKRFTKRYVASVLRRAAKVLDKYGWIADQFGNKDIGFCAVGALEEASKDGYIISDQLGMAVPSEFGTVTVWNDQPYRKVEDVTFLLRSEARKLEHGGELYV